jgi:cytochrome b561
MGWRNTPESFGTLTKTLHWVMALFVIGLLGIGLWMTGLENSPDKFKIYALHKSFGICVLALVFARILWHVYSRKPGFVDGMKPWEKLAAHAAHIFLYLAMIVMPLSGWLMSSAKGYTVTVFFTFDLPHLISENEEWGKLFSETHELLGYALIAAVAVHVGAALKHHFVNKDATLKRMLPFK